MGVLGKINAKVLYPIIDTGAIALNPYIEPPKLADSFNAVNAHVLYLSIEENGKNRELQNKGQRQDYYLMDGRLESPKQFPANFNFQRQCKIELEPSFPSDRVLRGVCYFVPQINSRLGLESFFGEYVQLEVKLDN